VHRPLPCSVSPVLLDFARSHSADCVTVGMYEATNQVGPQQTAYMQQAPSVVDSTAALFAAIGAPPGLVLPPSTPAILPMQPPSGAVGPTPPLPLRLLGKPSAGVDELLMDNASTTTPQSDRGTNSAQDDESTPKRRVKGWSDLERNSGIDNDEAPAKPNTKQGHGHFDFEQLDDMIIGVDDVKTLMIKNIPCRCTEQNILDAIKEVGHGSSYNFFYLPTRRNQSQNFGYAFVGFVDCNTAKEFALAITGYRFADRRSNKSCVVAPARIQGFGENMEYFQRTRRVRRPNQPIMSVNF